MIKHLTHWQQLSVLFKKVIVAVGLSCVSLPEFAEECSQATLAEFRTVNDTITEQERNLRKLTARADGQEFRLFDLPEDVYAGLPPQPETPVVTVTEEDTDEGDATDDTVSEDDGEADNADVAEAATDETVAQPMQDAENPALFRRMISLRDATLLDAPGGTGDGPGLSTYAVWYVYDDDTAGGDEWLQVGNQLREGPVGWISAEAALPWSSMLVMQFTPRGQRERVLFFKDATPLSDIVNSPFFTNEVRDIYADIDSEQDRLAGDPGGVPNWNEDMVAIEPETAVTFTNEPYLLPT